MLTDLHQLVARYGMNITGVLHVGAHIGEEAQAYAAEGVSNVMWVEANPEIMPTLQSTASTYGHQVANVCITDAPDATVTLNVTNNVMSSSILPFGTHADRAPQCVYTHTVEVPTMTIDQLCERRQFHTWNLLNMDIQGAELLALKGAHNALHHVDWLFTEINFDELYIGCARAWELDALLWQYRLYRAETWMAQGDVGWGDALYVRGNVWRP